MWLRGDGHASVAAGRAPSAGSLVGSIETEFNHVSGRGCTALPSGRPPSLCRSGRVVPARLPVGIAVIGITGVMVSGCGGGERAKTVTRTVMADTAVAVPDVRGKGIAEARRRLSSLGLRVSVRRQESKQFSGDVLREAPTPGVRIDRAASVELTVARKPKLNPSPPSTVPAPPRQQETQPSPGPDPFPGRPVPGHRSAANE